MNRNLLSLLVAVVCFVSSEAVAFDMLSRRRRPVNSFREIYEDNAVAFKDGILF